MNNLIGKQPGYLTQHIKFHCTKLELASWSRAAHDIPLYKWIRDALNGALMDEYRVTIQKSIICPNCKANLHIDAPTLPNDKLQTPHKNKEETT
tara:strand:- start:573 stop:854 length:282 start_codon:yes stop_codon:yes gene_type:complete